MKLEDKSYVVKDGYGGGYCANEIYWKVNDRGMR